MERPEWANLRRFLLVLALGALLLAPPARASAAEPEAGAITGTVTAEKGGEIGGLEVCAKAVDVSRYVCVPLPNGGAYEIPGLPEGEYQVGFWPTGNLVTQFWQDAPTWETAKAEMVTAGATVGGIDATLVKGATIGGVVTESATGAPVAEVEACASFEKIERCADTNAAGEYLIDGLAGAAWTLNFYAQKATADVVSQAYPSPVEVAPGEPRAGVNVALGPGGQIAGTVRQASTGAPLAEVEVCVTTASSPTPLSCVHTPSSGAFRFTRVWPGSFKVVFSPEPTGSSGPGSYPTEWWGGSSFESATPIRIAPPQIVSGVDASFAGPPTPAAAPPTPVTKKPVLKCKRGFVKRNVHGKPRCEKRHKPKARPKKHKRRHRHRPAGTKADRR